jgi:hypothetical protein
MAKLTVSHPAAFTLNSLIGLAQARICKKAAYELSSSWTSNIKSLSGPDLRGCSG